MNDFPLFPEQASSVAPLVDALYLGLVAITGAVSLLIWISIFYLAIKYRRRPDNELAQEQEPPMALEMTWTILPAIIFIGVFIAGAWVFFRMNRVPDGALEVYATGRQWMWKFQHPTGQREINTLHVPVGRPIKITMASEDVIHSLWFPSFRVKMDVLPNRFRSMWFEATKTGSYHIFCAEYCGTKHSGMIGKVVVMEPSDYEIWLSGAPAGETLEQAGGRLFRQFNCHTCHEQGPTARGPSLHEILGKTVKLKSGETITVDEGYLRESILLSTAKVVAGYEPVMPTYQGQISEEGVLQLIAYIKSLTRQEGKSPQP